MCTYIGSFVKYLYISLFYPSTKLIAESTEDVEIAISSAFSATIPQI